MRPGDRAVYQRLERQLDDFERKERVLPGISSPDRRRVFLEQLLESIRRIKYVAVLQQRPISPDREDPRSELFDPLKAAIRMKSRGEYEEACWLVFLFVHFGKHRRGGWRYAREVYGGLGSEEYWTWERVSRDPEAFRSWLREHEEQIGRPGAGFGNHHKYQSLSADGKNGTGDAVATYVQWVRAGETHLKLFDDALADEGGDRREAFHRLYQSMTAVKSFGRVSRFDYLTMIAKLGLADIVAPSAYLGRATGPAQGARALFGVSGTSGLDDALVSLDRYLEVGMQVLEDGLCNWNKSPETFKAFRG